MTQAVIVLMGITGDLAKRKIIPALYHLVKDKKIDNIAIVGSGTRDIKVSDIMQDAKEFIAKPAKKHIDMLEKRIRYVQGDINKQETFQDINKEIHNLKKEYNLKNVLYYLATSPDFFQTITTNIGKCDMHKSKTGWVRIAFEKPFGSNLKHAQQLNKATAEYFKEEQIYRSDHYLGKELVQNMAVLRFTNTFLEPIWNNKHIDHVQIILNEKVGVEDRARFYDKYGALKDMLQSHIMQLIALTAMEAPAKLNAEHIRNEKSKVLESIRTINKKDVVLGQYQGYLKEKGVDPNSTTETFVALKMYIDNIRWMDIPFYIKTGKALEEKSTTIYVQFEKSPCELFEDGDKSCPLRPNHLVIKIQPDEGFFMCLNAKEPGSNDIKQITMNYSHKATMEKGSPEAYENILEHVLKGDQSIFVRSDELEESWKLVDPLTKLKHKLVTYKKGKMPKEALDLMRKDEKSWWL